MKRFASLLTIVICLSAGCIPGTKVVKNPGSDDCGIRYYRPKPYLLITPHENQDQIPTEEYVRIELEFLPDFSEEYSIHIRPGLGTNQTSVTLEDGWNLTALNVELDSQFSDNVEAVTEGIARLAPTAGGSPFSRDGGAMRSVVRATNVPIGYYESIVSRGSDCKKRIYGWRYIGFSPYAPCPLESSGVDQQCCETSDLYGLVFVDGTMTFKPIQETRDANGGRLSAPENNIHRALDKFRGELSTVVPPVLESLGIEDVSNKDIDVAENVETGLVTITAALNREQFEKYRAIDATRFEIAAAISSRFARQHGVALDVIFEVVDDG